MKVAVIGSRLAVDLSFERILENLPKDCQELVSGGSGAVDLMAEALAKKQNLKLKCFLPEYEKYGKCAPLVRNIKIIEYSDLIIAFWDNISHGTKFVIKEALKRNVPVKTIYIKSKNSILK
ncbi:MAG: hypothetical protein J6C55_00030 [Oscillospiraceae bacterium]|nr:hypothetical protein [Oscillospiraceae bacterium]